MSFETVGVDPIDEMYVGSGVGLGVGSGRRGVFIGEEVGEFVGDEVGDFVGVEVGAFVGDEVGDFVGDCVGDEVGKHVGLQYSSQTSLPGIAGAVPAQSELKSVPSAQPWTSSLQFSSESLNCSQL